MQVLQQQLADLQAKTLPDVQGHPPSNHIQDTLRGFYQATDLCRCVIASFERACNICHKRIGHAVIVAYPNNTLAHYSCYKRSETPAVVAEKTTPVQVYDISNDPDFAL